MRNKILFKASILIFCFASFLACNSTKIAEKFNAVAQESSSSDTRGEWQSLFNGKNLEGWHVFNNQDTDGKWSAIDGTLFFDSSSDAEGGDLVTDNDYENFEFALEWKISPCGNSGIFWGVQEDGKIDHTFHSAPEMQVLDNSCHPDAKIKTHRAGDLYDMIECSEENVKPAGEWNAIKIIADNGKYQFYQNGVNVVSFEMFNTKWDEMIEDSKFKGMEHFGKYRKGKFALQDHGNDVWFRDIKIKEI